MEVSIIEGIGRSTDGQTTIGTSHSNGYKGSKRFVVFGEARSRISGGLSRTYIATVREEAQWYLLPSDRAIAAYGG